MSSIFQITFDEALKKYTDGKLSFEQFLIIALLSIRRDIQKLQKQMVVAEL